MQKVYIVNGCRTAIGSYGGSLKDVPAAKLGSIVIKEALNRANVPADKVDEVFMGCVLTTALGQNPARQMTLGAGLRQRHEGRCGRRPRHSGRRRGDRRGRRR